MSRLFEKLFRWIFVICLFLLVWAYGYLAHRYQIFPYSYLNRLETEATETVKSTLYRLGLEQPWWYIEIPDRTVAVTSARPEAVSPGLTLIGGIGKGNELFIRIVDPRGRTIHNWDIDWFKLWPNVDHLAEELRPKSKPGAVIHGIALLDNGDLVFNFEALGLTRLDMCGRVVWRLPYRTHHSVYLDQDGSLWVAGQVTHKEKITTVPNIGPGSDEYFILKVSPDGRLLEKISLLDLLKQNDLTGLLYMPSTDNLETRVSGDLLHLNDIELFPADRPEGFFRHGDILVSLRNVNAILVFDGRTRKVKYVNVGGMLRQHDPDFVDGNTISVLDNNNLRPEDSGAQSRILKFDVANGTKTVVFEGTKDHPFYSSIMGKHQYLPNGNLLIAEATGGRAFEVSPQGEVVWEYYNIVGDGLVGVISAAQRLAPRFDEAFFRERARACSG